MAFSLITRRMDASLNNRVISRLVFALSLCVLVLGFLEFSQQRSEIENNLDSTLDEVTKRLSGSLAFPVWNIDYEVVNSIVITEMEDRNILAVIVTDELSSAPVSAKTRDERWRVVDVHDSENVHSSRMKTMPIDVRGNNLGSVTVYVSDRFSTEKLLSDVMKLIVRMAIMLVFLVVVMIVVVSQMIAKPIMNLSKICKKVAYGDYSLSLDTTRKDEIGSLARSFDHMREAVEEKITNLNMENLVRKRSESELEKLQSYLSNIVDSMPSILVGIDNVGCITQWNIEARNVTGVQKEAALGRPLLTIIPWLDIDELDLEEAVQSSDGRKIERINLHIDDEVVIADVAIYPLVSDEDREILGVVIRIDDIRERIKLEEVMIQTEKMMSVGGLAAGMAHEINNPLSGMLQSVQVLQNRLLKRIKKNEIVADEYGLDLESLFQYMSKREIPLMLKSILDSGERASRIIQNMLSFSRKSKSLFTSQNINNLLDQAVELASNDYDLKKKYDFKKISIVREYQESGCMVRCDPSSMQQVFLNILKNAAHAMLTEEQPENKQPQIAMSVRKENDYVKITLSDNGPGMDEDTQKRVFEPFFTTKNIGEGTGLGLSVSFFIIKENHKGRIEVKSAPGQGASFVIILPS